MKHRLIGLIPVTEGGHVLPSLLGRSPLRFVLEAVLRMRPDRIIIAAAPGTRAAVASEAAGLADSIIEIRSGRGFGAVLRAAGREERNASEADILFVPSDLPLLEAGVLRSLVAHRRRRKAAGAVLSAWTVDPGAGDRVIRTGTGGIRVIGKRRSRPGFRVPVEVSSGAAAFRAADVWPALARLPVSASDADAGLADFVAVLSASGRPVDAWPSPCPDDILRIGSRHDLGRAAEVLRLRKIRALAAKGVTVLSPSTTWIDWGAAVGPETIIYPGTVIEGSTKIGRRCRILPHVHLVDTVIGNDVQILGSSVIEGAVIGNGVRIGPFARIRRGTVLRDESRIGNFVEMKATDFGKGSKAMHLSYLGDSEVGERVNVGAGTITCNYDGLKKNRTVIESGAFIGSGTELIAPVRIGRGAYVAAGSVITKDVAAGALAVARVRQVEKPGWADERQSRLKRTGR